MEQKEKDLETRKRMKKNYLTAKNIFFFTFSETSIFNKIQYTASFSLAFCF